MKLKFWLLTGFILVMIVIPLYPYRHAYTQLYSAQHETCPAIGYTARPAGCSYIGRDCSTTLSGGTVCTDTDIVAIIGFGGITMILGAMLILCAIGVSYPISRRFRWLT